MSKERRKRKKTPEQKTTSRKWQLGDRGVLIVIIVFAFLSALFIFDPKPFMGGDNGVCLSLAHSIVQHGSYNRLDEIGAPIETSQPPGYPLLLASLIAIFGEKFIPAKIFSFLAILAGLVLTYLISRKLGLSKSLSCLATLFLSINFDLMEFSHWILTEAGFFAGYLLTIFLFLRWEKHSRELDFILASVFATLTFYIRPTGLPLLGAFFVALILKRQWFKLAEYVGIVLALFLPWIVRNALVGGGFLGRYLSLMSKKQLNVAAESASFSDIVERIATNLKAYLPQHLPASFLPSLKTLLAGNPAIGYILGMIFLAGIMMGMILLFRRKHMLIPLFVLFYGGMLAVWPSIAAILRYIVVLAPLMILMVLYALKHFKVSWSKYISYSLLGLMLIAAFWNYYPQAKQNIGKQGNLSAYLSGNRFAGYHPVYIRFIEANEWIKQNAAEGAGIISRKPRLTWLFSRHPAKNYLFVGSDDVMADIDTSGADYVIIDRISGTTVQHLVPAIQKYPDRFQTVYVTKAPETYVLRIMPKPQPVQIHPDSVISEPLP